MRRVVALGVMGVGMSLGTAAWAKGPLGLGPKGFESFSTDNAGGGWVIHHHVRGDTLWGCGDVGSVETCTQVTFDAWRPTANMEMLHVTSNSQDAWFKLSSKGVGDTLYACSNPEGSPVCERIPLTDAPEVLVSLKRVWPRHACVEECGGEAPMSQDGARQVIEPKAYADMWLQLSVTGPGSANLYACRGLGKAPACVPAVPNWRVFDREDVGLSFSDIKVKNDDGSTTFGPGVLVKKLDDTKVGYEAGLREGDVVLTIGGYDVDRAGKASAMLAQFPAEQTFEVTRSSGAPVSITPRRKPRK